MKHKHILFLSLAILNCLLLLLTGCGKNKSEESANHIASEDATVEEAAVEGETTIEEKKYLSVETSIAYSAGNTNAWFYGNQRKEFPDYDACYVRIASRAITTGLFGRGKDDKISVVYRFTGVENCAVDISDGRASVIENDNPNIVEYTRTISAEKEKNADEDILIFRYSPKGAESMTLEVIYDDQVADKYDEFNTVYFTSPANNQESD